MAPDSAAFETLDEQAIALRTGHERRARDRRKEARNTPSRRRRARRRARRRTVLIALATLAIPFQSGRTKSTLLPQVLVSTSNFTALAPERAYDAIIKEAAALYKLDASLIRAVMRAESAFNPLVVSRAGAAGLMQLMPGLAREMGVSDRFDPRDNIMGGARYLSELLDRHHGNIALTLASYNAGPGAVARYHNRIPPFKETRNYVKKITGFLAQDKQDNQGKQSD